MWTRALVALLAVAETSSAAAAEAVRCSLNGAPAMACSLAVMTKPDGRRVLTFVAGQRPIRIIGKAQTGWWSGTFNGRPAMGLEINRGYSRFSTIDLTTTFDWWYPGREHGTY